MKKIFVFLLISGMVFGIANSSSAESITVFYTDFESPLPTNFSGITTIESTQGYGTYGFSSNFLRNTTGGSFGGGGNDGVPGFKTALTLTGLPEHNSINIGFFLAIIDSWDGSYSSDGSDAFNMSINGNIIFSQTFSNRPPSSYVQTYTPPVGGLLTTYPTYLGFRDIYPDSAYNMGLDSIFSAIPHTGETLVLEWFASGGGWQGGIDESWAIDNIKVQVNPVPIPPTVWLLGSGLIGLVGLRRKFRKVKWK